MQYQVDSDAVTQATASMRATISDIQTDVNGLLNQMTALQNSWAGSAATAFQTVITDWRHTQRRVEENLEDISSALARAGEQYREAERVNTELFRVA